MKLFCQGLNDNSAQHRTRVQASRYCLNNKVQRSLECISEFPLNGLTGRRCRRSWTRRRQFTGDVVGHTRHCIDRMCPELWGRDIPLQKWVGRSVPLHPPPFQGSDVLVIQWKCVYAWICPFFWNFLINNPTINTIWHRSMVVTTPVD